LRSHEAAACSIETWISFPFPVSAFLLLRPFYGRDEVARGETRIEAAGMISPRDGV
jgi:hypothetical protein